MRASTVAAMLTALALGLGGCEQAPCVEHWPLALASDAHPPVLAYAFIPTAPVEPTAVVPISEPVRCISALPNGGFLVFHPGGLACLRQGPGSWAAQYRQPLAHEVRASAQLGEHLAVITDGRPQRRRALPEGDRPAETRPWLLGGAVRLAWLTGERLVLGAPEEPTGENPYRIRSGRFAGEENLLVFVYNRAPFDDVKRRRPWIYRVVEDTDGPPHLQPRWRGTSFAHPFRDATFADLTGAGVGEIAALEVHRDGGRLLTAYHFEGFGLEGLAPSVRLPAVEDCVKVADWVGDDAQELVVRTLDGRFLFYALDTTAGTLAEVLRVTGPTRALNWLVTDRRGDDPGQLLCLLPGGRVWRANSRQCRHRAATD